MGLALSARNSRRSRLTAAYGLDVVVDDSLSRQQDLYLEGGDHAHLVHISGTDFRKLMEGRPTWTVHRAGMRLSGSLMRTVPFCGQPSA
jgi:hypothetical protein